MGTEKQNKQNNTWDPVQKNVLSDVIFCCLCFLFSTPPSRTAAFEEFKQERGSEINRILIENKGKHAARMFASIYCKGFWLYMSKQSQACSQDWERLNMWQVHGPFLRIFMTEVTLSYKIPFSTEQKWV